MVDVFKISFRKGNKVKLIWWKIRVQLYTKWPKHNFSTGQTRSKILLGNRYRVILKKVSFGVFSIILVFKEEKNFTMKSKDKVLSLSKFS